MPVTVVVQLTLNAIVLSMSVWFLIQLKRLRIENHNLRVRMSAATYFANVLAERGVGLMCDDCGNRLEVTDHIDIIDLGNGKMYVGHKTHGRGFDEMVKRGIR